MAFNPGDFRFTAENRRGSGSRFIGTPTQILLPSEPVNEENLAQMIEDLEKKLEVELAIRTGAENLLRTVSKKSEKSAVLKRLEESSQKVERIREKLAVLNGRNITRHGCAHSISDLVDMIEETKMSKEEMQERIQFVKEKIAIEMKVKVGAENLAKVYGAGLGDKKAMSDLFAKLMDSNTKINLLKVALQKYQIGTGAGTVDTVVDVKSDIKEEDLKHWLRLRITGKLKIKILGTKNLAPVHKKLDARCILKVDSVAKARSSVKSKTSLPVWNEEFEVNLENAGDIELQIVDKNDLYAVHFFDLNALTNDVSHEEKRLDFEPRGELSVIYSFTKRLPGSNKDLGRRAAVKKPKIPLSMIRFFGYKPAVEMSTQLLHENTRRKRTMKLVNREKDGLQTPLPEILDEDERQRSMFLTQKPKIDDFVLLKVLGKGNFGKVMLVEEKRSKNTYAIKVLKKEFVVENDEIESIQAEKRVFQIANKMRHPFLVKLHSCFQSDDRLYFVMEYISGGDLMMHIQRCIFPEARAKLYAAEVLLALEYLHSNNIVYRDLKLDNILLDLDGHIKIADYGLCKENLPYGATTNTFCGTPEFMAPEILLEKDYGKAVDWWAFGVLIYEMLLAQSPFKGDEEEEIFDAILEGDVHYPANKLAPEAISIMQQLLERDPQKRLGSGPEDAAEVKRHPFWAGMDFDAIYRKEVDVTYKPVLKDARDTNNFDPEFTREIPRITPMDSHLTVADQEEFDGFSYVAEWINDNETAV